MLWPDLSRMDGVLNIGMASGQPVLVCLGALPRGDAWVKHPDFKGRSVWSLQGNLRPRLSDFQRWFDGLAASDVRDTPVSQIVLRSDISQLILTETPDDYSDIQLGAILLKRYGIDVSEVDSASLLARLSLDASSTHGKTAEDVANDLSVRIGLVPVNAAPQNELPGVDDEQWRLRVARSNAEQWRSACALESVRAWIAEHGDTLAQEQFSDLLQAREERLASPLDRSSSVEVPTDAVPGVYDALQSLGAKAWVEYGQLSLVVQGDRAWELCLSQSHIDKPQAARLALNTLPSPRLASRVVELGEDALRKLVKEFNVGKVVRVEGELYLCKSSVSVGRSHLSISGFSLTPNDKWQGEVESESTRMARWDHASDRDDLLAIRGNMSGVSVSYQGKGYVADQKVVFTAPIFSSFPYSGIDHAEKEPLPAGDDPEEGGEEVGRKGDNESSMQEPSGSARARNRIDDAGEKIGGARKDLAGRRGDRQGMMSREDFYSFDDVQKRGVTKAKIWPVPDWRAMHEQGASVLSLMRFSTYYKSIPAKPQDIESIDNYFSMVEKLGSYLGERGPSFFDGEASAVRGRIIEMAQEIGAIHRSEREGGYTSVSTTELSLSLGNYKRWTSMAEHLFMNPYGSLEPKRFRECWGENSRSWFLESWAKRNLSPKAKDGEEQDSEKAPERAPKNASMELAVQAGAPKSRDADATPEMLLEDFGFRAVEFGKWVSQDERQQVLNLTYDSFHTLAGLLDVPHKAISFGGKLALSFGARGHGKASGNAHYEPARVVLHLTRFKGVGALAHEWAHGLDDWMGRRLIGEGEAQSVSWVDDFMSNQITQQTTVSRSRGRKTFSVSTRYCSDSCDTHFANVVGALFHRPRTFREYVQSEKGRQLSGSLSYSRQLMRALESVGCPVDKRQEVVSALDLKNGDCWGALTGGDASKTLEEIEALDVRCGNSRWPDVLRQNLLSAISTPFDELLGKALGDEVAVSAPRIEGVVGDLLGVELPCEGLLMSLRQSMLPFAMQKALDILPEDQQLWLQSDGGNFVTRYETDARRLDKGGARYWSTPHELFARAFSCWIFDELERRGWRDDCLVRQEQGGNEDGSLASPFPQKDDRKVLRQAFDEFAILLKERLVHTVRTQEAEKDNTEIQMRCA